MCHWKFWTAQPGFKALAAGLRSLRPRNRFSGINSYCLPPNQAKSVRIVHFISFSEAQTMDGPLPRVKVPGSRADDSGPAPTCPRRDY